MIVIETKTMLPIFILFLCSTHAAVVSEDNNVKIKTVDLPPLSSEIGSRIIGGTPTNIERFPYTVQVLYNNQLSCGGSLLTRRHVLSAAHCFVNSQNNQLVSAQLFRIRAGSSLLNSGGSLHGVSVIIVHERYNTPSNDNDIAVLLLSTDVRFSASVAVAAIPRQGAVVADNASVTHVGWGRTNVNVEPASPVLNEVTIRTINRAICQQRYAYLQSVMGQPFPVTENMICAGLLDVGGKDACQGDSGGPLIYQNVVVGVTSWGWGCAEPLFPGVSARVSSYTTWINQTVTRYNAAPVLNSASIALLTVVSLIVMRV